MQTLVYDAAHDAALKAVRSGFYGGDLAAAVGAGEALLATIDPASDDASAQATRARALLWLVRCARRGDALDNALSHVFAGITAARAAGAQRLEIQLQAQYVHVLASLGQNENALDAGYQVLRRAAACADTVAQAACWLALGQVHWAMQQWSAGEEAYTQALKLAELCGDKEVRGLASNGIAAMEDHHARGARADGRVDEASAHARRSFALLEDFIRNSQEIGDRYNAWMGKYNQACCLLGMGEQAAACALLNTQLALLGDERGSRRQLILQVLGDVHLAEGRHDQAVACETEALELAERLQLPMLAMDACRSLVDALERSGDFSKALAQHRRFHALYVQLASNRAQAQARALAVVYDTEKTHALAERQRQRADELASANSSLVEERALLQRSSMEDALTGLANRRRFDQWLEEALASTRQQTPDADGNEPAYVLALIDVDHFKRVNDRFSHLIGDEVLRRLGALLLRCCRKQDLAARYGGEEFALILANMDRKTARATCERLRAAVVADAWSAIHPELQVTVSIGVVHLGELRSEGDSGNPLSIADARLYAAKRGGRNRVVDAAG